jgi:hypothetical protein
MHTAQRTKTRNDGPLGYSLSLGTAGGAWHGAFCVERNVQHGRKRDGPKLCDAAVGGPEQALVELSDD